MLRLHESDDDAEQMELTRRALQDFYAQRIIPRREHPEAIGKEPSNKRNGCLTGTEYDLVELDCTMSGRLAIANIVGRMPFSTECLRSQDTCELPSLPVTPTTTQPQPDASAQAIVWEEATPEEMAQRANEGTALLIALFILIVMGFTLYSMLGGMHGAA